ncbi:FecR domain-containing protein [Chitinophaga sedimenti]|uniref:FecR family protein n=1 Tax=Chitinophaga sedimenti TaxID=2033606 RepID=UPI002006404C|nr:FecR domain-containing protein [Chitinophaga sedimenti]MCK7554920.1 FecR domain-containing protein [Chitinophaga sedimenti]
MVFRFFGKKRQENEAQRGIADAIEHLKETPGSWDAVKMGDEHATGEKILGRLLLSIDDKRRRVRRVRTWSAAAAVLALALLAGLYRHDVTPDMLIVKTPAAQSKQLVLPDGSRVWLNAGSRLRYPSVFKGNTREVVLEEGEAYFDIRPDQQHAFVVLHDQLQTTVLGTSFNIRAYRFFNDVTVTVATGKVRVSDQVVTPDQQASYSRENGRVQVKAAAAADALGWTQGRLLFTNEDFREVAGLLENKFNVKIIFDEEALTHYHFTASFEAGETLHDVLDALTLTKGLQYSRSGATVHIFQSK